MNFRSVRGSVFACVLAGVIASSGWGEDRAGHQPLTFQAVGENRFSAHRTGYDVVLEHDGLVFEEGASETPLRLKFVGANRNPQSSRLDSSRVLYRNLYPGVDAIYYDRGGKLEYDLDVAPGHDAGSIAFVVEGATRLEIGARGELLARTDRGELRLDAPVIYQRTPAGARRVIGGGYAIDGNRVTFQIAAYDHSKALIIDPVLTYSTFVGNSGDAIMASTADSSGNAYLVGRNAGLILAEKLSPDGTTVLLRQTLGTTTYSFTIEAVAVTSSGQLYITGSAGIGLPTTSGAYLASVTGGSHAFIAVLNSSFGLTYCSYLAGTTNAGDLANGIAVDSTGNAYITGYTNSTTFPVTSGVVQTTPSTSGQTGFVAKFNPAGSGAASLVYSTFLGGPATASVENAIAVDSSNNAYVTGTAGPDFPVTVGAYQYDGVGVGQGGVYVTKLNSGATALTYSAYLGNGQAIGIAVDGSGDAYLTGNATVSDFPTTTGAYQVTFPGAFVTELNTTGTSLVYSTFLSGPSENAIPVDIALTPACLSACSAYISGYSSAIDFPVINAIQSFNASAAFSGNDAFIVELSGSGAAATYSTYLGGSSDESNGGFLHLPGIGVMSTGDAILGGETGSPDFPVTLTTTPARGVFASRIGPAAGSEAVAYPLSLTFSSQTVTVPSVSQTVNLRNMGTTALAISSIAAAGDYAQTNTCGSSLAGGTECVITVIFTPTTTGVRAGTVTINGTLTVNLTGTGTNGAYMNLTPTSLIFSNQIVGSASASQSVTLSNVGNEALTLSGFSMSGDYAQSNTCPASLASNTNCIVSISFLPTQEGLRSGGMTVSSNTSSPNTTVTLTGTGAAGTSALTLATSFLVFTPQSLTTTSPAQNVLVTNTGNVPVVISSATASGDYLASGCVVTLNPGGACNVRVTFSPTAAGVRSGTVTITDSTSASPHSFSLSGTGVATSETITITPASLDFADQAVGQTSARALTIVVTNTGNLPVTIDRVVESGDFRVTSNGCSTLAFRTPPATCNINVVFTPTAVGARTGTVVITDNATGSPQTVVLSGNGLAVSATATLSPDKFAFNTQPVGLASFTQTAVITNTGNVPINLTSATITGTNAGDFSQTNFCIPEVLTPTRTCGFTVTFTPTATGVRTATLNVVDDAGTQTVTLSGTGETATLAASFVPASMTFEAQATGTSSPTQILLAVNSGNEPLIISNVVASGNYTISSGFCTETLNPNASCSLGIQFTPTGAVGTQTGTITFTDNAGTGTQVVNLSGSNVATAPAIKLTPSGLAFAAFVIGTTSAPQSVTVTNTSAATVTGLAVGNPSTADFTIASGSNNCGASLTAGASCSFSVTFDPTAAGARTGAIIIANSAANQTLNLAGFGLTSLPSAFVRDPALVFPNQVIATTSANQNITLANNGDVPLTISSVAISAGDFAISNNCPVSPSTLNPNSTCTVGVTFTPTAAGSRTATVTITDNAPSSPQVIAVSGLGLTPTQILEVDRKRLVFPSESVGNTANQPNPQTVTLTNTGNSPVTITGASSSSAAFVVGNSCPVSPATLPPGPSGNTCTLTVTFTPTAAGAAAGTLTITDSASATALTVTLAGTGLTDTKTVDVTPAEIAFTPQVVGTSSGFTQNVVLSNQGNTNISVTSVTVTTTYSLSNGCNGVVLTPTSTCTIGIGFTPTAAKVIAGALTIVTTGTPATKTVGLTGTGIAAASEISLSQTSLVFDQQVVGVASLPQTLYYYNQSSSAVNLTNVVLTGADFSMTNNCVTSVSALGFCTIRVTFKPTAAGALAGSIVITDSAPGSPRTITLSGTGVAAAAPGVNLTPTSLTFASQALGSTSVAQNINLTNSGEANLSITGITVTGANPGDYAQTNNCPATLIPDFSCNIAVTFKPLATRTRTASISIADNVTPSPQTVALTGTGAPGTTPLVTFTPSSLTFSNVPLNTASASQMSTLQNTGAAALSISSIVASGTVAGDFTETNNCPASVAVSGTCTITVTFKPSSTINQTGAVTVTDNTPNGTDALALTGNGVAPAVNLSATTLAFGSQAHGTTSAAKTVTLENSGSLALSIGTITATSNYNIVSNTCPASLGPGLTCTFGVTFSPATTGAEDGYVMINDNAGDSPQFITLTGTGT
jgi:hypothetical protein